MIKAAGILILNTEGKALFLKRGPGGDMPGTWCIPGGRVEEGESVIDAAVRETLEEAGYKAKVKDLVLWTRRVSSRETTGPAPTPALDENSPASLGEVIAAAAQVPAPGAMVVPGEQVDFTTYVVKDIEPFTPILCDEHVGYAWAPITEPPEPLHPGCRISLKRFGMTELEVAEAIRDGELSSPQFFQNMWLYAIRITGTGYAYRGAALGKAATEADKKAGKRIDKASGMLVDRPEEYVWRNPSYYLNDEFLKRCNGLQVVLEHPEKMMLDPKEYDNRAVGSVFVPYIANSEGMCMPNGDEVWGIAKVYDEKTAIMMEGKQLSTSPGVVWIGTPEGTTSTVDGTNFLIEGKPALLDHIAICWQGVWDKGGDPRGVLTTRGDSLMTAEELKKKIEDEAAARAIRDQTIDKTLEGFGVGITAIGDSVTKLVARLDADDKERMDRARADARGRADNFKFSARKDGEKDEEYKERHDAEEKAYCDAMTEAGEESSAAADKARKGRKDSEDTEDKARKDAAEEAEREKARADALKVAGLSDDVVKRLAALEAGHAKLSSVKDEDTASFGRVQHRADGVYMAQGGSAPRPALGESLIEYRKRIVVDLKPNSPTWAKAEINIAALDEALFAPIETQVYAEALKAAADPSKVPAGKIRAIHGRSDSGHAQTTYVGDPLAWMRQFMPPLQSGELVNNRSRAAAH